MKKEARLKITPITATFLKQVLGLTLCVNPGMHVVPNLANCHGLLPQCRGSRPRPTERVTPFELEWQYQVRVKVPCNEQHQSTTLK